MIKKQQKTLMRRRITAIIVATALVVILIPTLIAVNYIVKIEPFYDVDDTKYLIKYKNGVYAMYDTDGDILRVDEEYGYYVTDKGTLVKVDPETGEYEIFAVVDTEGNEEIDVQSRILMFPHLERDQVRSLEVFNSNDTIKFHRYNVTNRAPDDSSDFIINDSYFAQYDPEIFSSIFVNTAYTLTKEKVKDPIKDENGEFSEYGLVAEVRYDDEGKEYNYSPTYYVITDKSGNKYKVIVGDPLVTGGGYYAQYVSIDGETETKRDAVYVLDNGIGETIFEKVEHFVKPTLLYPMTLNTHFDVQNFMIRQKGVEKPIVGFSFIDLADRQNTIYVRDSFKFTQDSLAGYQPNFDSMYNALYNLYNISFAGVEYLDPTDEEIIKCGLGKEVEKDGEKTMEYDPEYRLSFDYDVLDDNGKYVQTVTQLIFISEKNENGNYYAYSLFFDKDNNQLPLSYDMVVEVEPQSLEFLAWDSYDWINPNIFELDLSFAGKIRIEAKDYWAEFIVDNSKNQTDDLTNVTHMEIIGTDSDGNSVHTLSVLDVVDKNGIRWTITPNDITAVDSTGEELKINTQYFAHNILDVQVRSISAPIEARDGSIVEVSTDEVVVTLPNGQKITYVRYATELFKRYYQTLLVSSVEDTYIMSAEEGAQDKELLLTVTVTNIVGDAKEYKFYSLTSRKAYLTINGVGGFYILSNRVDKIVSDAQKFFDFELIEPSAKN